MRSPWINEVIRLSNSAIPHFIDCLSTSAAITLHSCGYNNTERRGEEWEWRWSALEQCIKFNKHDYAGAYQAHSCLQPPLTKHRQPQPSETENTERLWIEIQYVSRRWTGMFCWKKQKTKKKRSAELTRGWCALSPRLIRTSALLLSLHSFTSDTERYACVSRVMWVCPSVCQCFFMLPFDRLDGGVGGGMKVAYAVVSESLWMMFSSSAEIPRAPKECCLTWEGRKESGERWLWVALPSYMGLCRSTQLLIWFGSPLPSRTNGYSMVGTWEHPLMYDLY